MDPQIMRIFGVLVIFGAFFGFFLYPIFFAKKKDP
jgi:phage shock protein PspC (stress-responsive transcriptional regulator)